MPEETNRIHVEPVPDSVALGLQLLGAKIRPAHEVLASYIVTEALEFCAARSRVSTLRILIDWRVIDENDVSKWAENLGWIHPDHQ